VRLTRWGVAMRRWCYPCALLLAVGCGVAGREWAACSCPADVRPETFAALALGMSEGEAEAALGAPAGDYRTRRDIGHLFAGPGAGSSLPPPPGRFTREWLTDEYAIEIEFDPDGTAVRLRCGVALRPPTWPEWLTRLFDR